MILYSFLCLVAEKAIERPTERTELSECVSYPRIRFQLNPPILLDLKINKGLPFSQLFTLYLIKIFSKSSMTQLRVYK
jgi:hypothetical protein